MNPKRPKEEFQEHRPLVLPSISLPETLARQIANIAHQEGKSKAQVLRELLKLGLSSGQRRHPAPKGEPDR
ncbi:MAG: ribbon-helix-helix protein, CopG family [Dehalococcoidia bacterium]